MKMNAALIGICATLLAAAGCTLSTSTDSPHYVWAVHDTNRPHPPIVTASEQPGRPPSDAIVLFNGRDLSQWLNKKKGPANWELVNGYMQANRTGDIHTKQAFGNCQLHIEWAAPAKVTGTGQGRGNSGIFLMDQYEVQVLDSYDNKTYADGYVAAVYGQHPPLVNASRKPGQWQSFDIIFHRPKFGSNGKVIRPARLTVLHNGIVVQDNIELKGATFWKKRAEYHPHADRLPIRLQDHRNPVRFRNIWIRELPEPEHP